MHLHLPELEWWNCITRKLLVNHYSNQTRQKKKNFISKFHTGLITLVFVKILAMARHTLVMLNLTALFFFLPDTVSLLLSSSFSSNAFLSSQLSLMYTIPSKKRHKINPLLSICALQNHPASNQYTFRLVDKGNRCMCVFRLLCTEERFLFTK